MPNTIMHVDLRHSQRPCAIIVGLDSLQGLSSARILAGRGIPVLGVAKDPKNHCCKTRACREIQFVDTAGDDLVTLLLALGPEFSQKPVLFPCQDKNVMVISRNRTALREWYHIVLPPHETVELLIDKIAFYRYAEQNGLPIPKTYALYSPDDAKEAAAQLTFPCILKPPWRPETWTRHTKTKATRVNDAADLLSQYEHYSRWIGALIVQEWIEGSDRDHYTCNCYFDDHSRPLVTFTTRKIRQWQPRTGQACLAEACRNDVVLRETVKLFESVRLRGLAYLEMKFDTNKRQYLIIEPNVGRPTGRAAMAEASGVELLYTMYCDALGLPLPEDRTQNYNDLKWMHVLRDIQAAVYHWRRNELSVKEWWHSLRGPKTYALFSFRDPAPFLHALKNAVPVLLSSKERGEEDFKAHSERPSTGR